MSVSKRDVLISFFMFTTDLQPGNVGYTDTIVAHMKELRAMGYDGFDLPIAPVETTYHDSELKLYEGLRTRLDKAELTSLRLTTNVYATRTFDPSSPYEEQRKLALAYLKSRVRITKALGADVMAGPIVLPYGSFPTTDSGAPMSAGAKLGHSAPRERRSAAE